MQRREEKTTASDDSTILANKLPEKERLRNTPNCRILIGSLLQGKKKMATVSYASRTEKTSGSTATTLSSDRGKNHRLRPSLKRRRKKIHTVHRSISRSVGEEGKGKERKTANMLRIGGLKGRRRKVSLSCKEKKKKRKKRKDDFF